MTGTSPASSHFEMSEGAARSAVAQPFGSPTRTPRVLLSSPEDSLGLVDGAWWPRTDNLTSELHDLVSAVTPQLGHIARIAVDRNVFSANRRRIDRADGIEVTGPDADQSSDVIRLSGRQGAQLDLLVIAANTPPELADRRMRELLGTAPDIPWTAAD
ncbi:hypothetical protein IU449_14350 [Nocardia higoensis]|uniref:Uncharacterized protein n=1 Tax=Nocardia higoensis TaxID=228599 RepID=A0ABS0DCX0_9NOCA|nr:DUF5994 family protein [Nocardia higoensis]MBF6355713.1 hypothetical protein [Nocardia higoensis]